MERVNGRNSSQLVIFTGNQLQDLISNFKVEDTVNYSENGEVLYHTIISPYKSI